MDPMLVGSIETAASMRTEDVIGLPLERTRLFHRVQSLFERADLIVSPTVSAPALRADQRADEPLVIEGRVAGSLRDAWYPYTPFVNLTGHPAISVPIGHCNDGTPAGLHAIGRLHEDARLLDLAAAIEALHSWTDRWPECGAAR
jgi:aspartyl-tRNA(Asn)/glutamyl-tRNA(Gln) amidotransferase subunit A